MHYKPPVQTMIIHTLTMIILLAVSQAQHVREFQSTDGKKLMATIQSANAKTVTLVRQSDSRKFRIPLTRLSAKDRDYVKQWLISRSPAKHPLGWKKLTIHAMNGTVMLRSHIHCGSSGIIPVRDKHEVYLPVGAVVKLSGGMASEESHAIYQGSSDWYVTPQGEHCYLSKHHGRKGEIISIDPNKDAMPPQKRARYLKQAAKSDITIPVTSSELPEYAGLNPRFAQLIVTEPGKLQWQHLGNRITALEILSQKDETFDFSGIQKLTTLRHIKFLGGKVKNLGSLAHLPLVSFNLKAKISPSELASLAKLTKLRHLSLENDTKGKGNRDEYNFLAKLTKLESLQMPVHYANGKPLNEAVLKSMHNLTICEVDHDTFNNNGEAIAHLKKLTKFDFNLGKIDSARMTTLMREGHFKHLQSACITPRDLLENTPELTTLSIEGITPQTNLSMIGALPKLKSLMLTGCTAGTLKHVARHTSLQNAQTVTLSHFQADNLDGLEAFPNLDHLRLHYSSKGPNSVNLSLYPNMKQFTAQSYSSLKNITGLGSVSAIRLMHCGTVSIGNGKPNKNLKHLSLYGCNQLENLDGLRACSALEHVWLTNCQNMKTASGLDKRQDIKLHVFNCGTVPNQGSPSAGNPFE